MFKELLIGLGLITAPAGTFADMGKTSPPFDRSYKLAGTFEFLGTADEGSSEFELPPPSGVVKVYYNTDGPRGEKWHDPRVGFFRCSRLQFSSFKRAWTNWNGFASWGKYDTTGDYPIARTIIVSDRTESDKDRTRGFFRSIGMPNIGAAD